MNKVYECPKCKDSDEFSISGMVNSKLYVDNKNEVTDIETFDEYHEDDSLMECLKCGHIGEVRDFTIGGGLV